MNRRDQRILLACVAGAAWLTLLLFGWTFGGASHLLLVVALVVLPWRGG